MANKFTVAVAGMVAGMVAELAAEPQWQPYATCLEIRAGGMFDKLRKEAFESAAESFVEIARQWPYEEPTALLGFAELAQMCREVEAACRAGETYEPMLAVLRALATDAIAQIAEMRAP